MISVSEARQLVLSHCRPLPNCRVDLTSALDLVLAEEARADCDIPTMTKSLMDGFAVQAGDLGPGQVEFNVIGQVVAGRVATQPICSGQAMRIMTGAQLPEGADAVVPVEQTDAAGWTDQSLQTVTISDSSIVAGNNIMPQGTIATAGDSLILSGTRLGPAAIAVLAEVGMARPLVYRRPRLAVIPTGDEIISVEQSPGPGKLRNSNGPMLTALAQQAGCEAVEIGVGRDDRQHLREFVSQGLQHDVLVLSGGVSAGTMDFVPGVLAEMGVQQVFHKIRMKPGKPLWFGIRDQADRRTLVFGLPGNPVSSFVCFHRFVSPALVALAGSETAAGNNERIPLLNPGPRIGGRDTYWPAVRRVDPAGNVGLEILDWQGSADLCTLSRANGLAFFPADGKRHEIGDRLEFCPIL